MYAAWFDHAEVVEVLMQVRDKVVVCTRGRLDSHIMGTLIPMEYGPQLPVTLSLGPPFAKQINAQNQREN
jgi:hypothetical protein